MQRTTTSRSRSQRLRAALAALFSLATALGLFAPGRAAADVPAAIQSASVTVKVVQTAMNFRRLPKRDFLQSPPEPAPTGFISDDLLNTATDLVKNGVRVRDDLADGTVYMHFEPQGFGGVLSVRYRR
jgi:hypothetical protein